jgi:hypothetical protein
MWLRADQLDPQRGTLTGESDGAMNRIFRRGKFRVTGARQFRVTTINGIGKKETRDGNNAGFRRLRQAVC